MSGARLVLALLAVLVALAACGSPDGGVVGSGAPTASFDTNYDGTTVFFDAGPSSDPVGDGLSYAWAFGDGASASGATVEHTYDAPGSYTVRLTVTDATGTTDVTAVQLPVGLVAGELETLTATSGAATVVPARAEGRERDDREDVPFVPGEVVVRFDTDVAGSAARLSVADVALTHVRDLALPGAALYRAPAAVGRSSAEARDATWALVRALLALPDVVDAHPNYLLQPTRAPNDPGYPLQWHYEAIELEAAWDRSTGDPDVIVAVLDTGILHVAGEPSLTHPDLVGQVTPGYDFITDVSIANDGDGRDADPYDVGDEAVGQASYHGTHVAGTVAARTNDASGVAGSGWSTRLQAVRVLGVGGGSFTDVLEALLWSAGLPVAGVPTNPTPARVANLSLGGPVPCSAAFQDAVDLVVAAGTTVVVAAGNAAVDAGGEFPANCSRVIAVGATDRGGERAWYSNYGARVDLMAPGGEVDASAQDGVYSLWKNDTTGAFSHAYAQGTSMAAPHVAGVVALMLDLEPDLSPEDVLALLRLTARPLTSSACTADLDVVLPGDACGAGLIDAAAALASVGVTPPPPSPGELDFEPTVVDFGSAVRRTFGGGDQRRGRARRLGDRRVRARAPTTLGPSVTTSCTSRTRPSSGELEPGEDVTLIDRHRSRRGVRRRVRTDSTWSSSRTVASGACPSASRSRTAIVQPTGSTFVGTFTVDATFDITVHGVTVYAGLPSTYEVLTMGAAVRVLAWNDANENELLDAGDLVGEHPTSVVVAGGARIDGVDIVLEPVVDVPEGLGTGSAFGRRPGGRGGRHALRDGRGGGPARPAWTRCRGGSGDRRRQVQRSTRARLPASAC